MLDIGMVCSPAHHQYHTDELDGNSAQVHQQALAWNTCKPFVC